jgi:hypothetical protein
LANRAHEGDSEALAILARHWWPREVPLSKQAIAKTGAKTVRESDVAASTLTLVTERFRQGRFPRVSTSKELRAWLKTLRHGKAVDKRRKEKTDKGIAQTCDDFHAVISQQQNRGEVSPDIDVDMKERLDRLLKQLSSRELAIVRCVENGIKRKNIPAQLSSTFGKVTRYMIDRCCEKWGRLLRDEFSKLR